MIRFTTSPDFAIKDLSFARAALEKIKADPMSGWLAPWDLLNQNLSNDLQNANSPEPANPETAFAASGANPETAFAASGATPETELSRIKSYAAKIQSDSDFLVCVGIGGSYLGHKAVLEALDGVFEKSRTKILYAGNSLSSHELKKVISTISNHDFSINIISKSGTTIEPNLAFEILKPLLYERHGDAAADRIYATTDALKGTLYDEAVAHHYHRLVVPDSVGGRYSVLTSVGLLPLATAGVDIDELLEGAKAEAAQYFDLAEAPKNAEPLESANASETASALHYATLRAALAQEGFSTEIFATFEPRFAALNEWLKQLFGESEGKDHAGLFPASVIYSTDLHSLGQYLQDGRRNIFETFLKLPKTAPTSTPETTPEAPSAPTPEAPDAETLKPADDISDPIKALDATNRAAESATISAHRAGKIPVLEIAYPDLSARSLGALLYFFELSCAISATLQGANPFDQPGVELYKSNLRALLK